MSLLAGVVSDGSPGSSLLIAEASLAASPLLDAAPARPSPTEAFRARFEGGILDEGFKDEGAAEPVDSSPSSPDASREEGCRRSVVDDLAMSTVERWWELARLRLLGCGEDMVVD
jgi:hypothetical protein